MWGKRRERGEQRRAVEGDGGEFGVAQRHLLLLGFPVLGGVQRARRGVGVEEASRHGSVVAVARLAQAVLVQRHQAHEHAHHGDHPGNHQRGEIHAEYVRPRRRPRPARRTGRPEVDELLHGVTPHAVGEGGLSHPLDFPAPVVAASRPDELLHGRRIETRTSSSGRAAIPHSSSVPTLVVPRECQKAAIKLPR